MFNQQVDQEREALESLRARRQTKEAVEGMSEEERRELQKLTDPDKLLKQFWQETRQEQEAEFLQQVEREYEAELIGKRNAFAQRGQTSSSIQRSHDLQQADANKREKIQKFYAARETRELAAEDYTDEAARLAHSLDDNGFTKLRQKWNNRPQARELIATVKNGVQQARSASLTSDYIAECAAVKAKQGYIPPHIARQIKEKYSGLGLNTNSNEVVNALTQALGR